MRENNLKQHFEKLAKFKIIRELKQPLRKVGKLFCLDVQKETV